MTQELPAHLLKKLAIITGFQNKQLTLAGKYLFLLQKLSKG